LTRSYSAGCLLFSDSDNGGISDIVAGVQNVYNRWSSRISRADFWALAANAAIIVATPNNTIPDIPFRWGRKDASVCNFDVGRLPDSEKGYNHVMSWAVDQLGLTVRETVALMGAHSLGRAMPANSGYDGAWDRGDSVFDNQYFNDMINIPWSQNVNDFRTLGITRLTHQWNANGFMFLNTDMALGFDIGADDPNAVAQRRCGGRGIIYPPIILASLPSCYASRELYSVS
jgi:catalase (peroxidase I)